MNKLLIIPALLALTLFSVYHHKIEGKKMYEQPMMMEKMEQKILNEQVEIYNVKKENNISEEKVFTITTEKDINTTRDSDTTLTVKVQNANNEEACNFFWYENDVLIGIGSTLEHSFEKGEHVITVIAKDAEGHESNATTIVTAWDYTKVETLHFDVNYGNLEYKEVELYDHKGRYIIMDDSTFAKRHYVYDEEDNRIENTVVYYEYPHESRQWLYTFDENHNQLSAKSINIETGRTLYYTVKTYDEEGNVTSSKSGNNEENLRDDSIDYGAYYEDNDYYEYNSTQEENKDDKTILNEAGKITYNEKNYDDMKIIEEYSYDDNGSMTQQISTMITENYKYDITIYNYDSTQDVSSTEQIYKTDEEVNCHYKITSTYNEDGSQNTEKREILDGICSEEVEENSFKKYIYDNDGRVKNIISSLENESDDNLTTLKVIKSYTNDLDSEIYY
jgi:hypothetical protein